MFNRPKKSEVKVFVEVLQNGELLSRTSRPFDKQGVIRLTSDPEGELTAPFYPLPTDIDLIKITKRGAEIDLDPNWEGFTTFEGSIEDINSHRNTQYTHIMTKGDYGSIAYSDLRVLIRIGKERPKSKKYEPGRPTGEYRGKLMKLLVGESRDFKSLGIGLLASLWLFGSFTLALMNRHDSSPKSFFDLDQVYTLPFIHPDHLELLPEALQNNLDRLDMIDSGFEYYMNFASTLLGFSSRYNPTIYRSTYDLYGDLNKSQRVSIREIATQQRDLQVQVSKKKLRSPLIIPAIKGESLDQKLLRVQSKIEIVHRGLRKTLEHRRAVTKSFRSDRGYRFEQYKKVAGADTPEAKEKEDRETRLDRKFMYQEASELAQYADSLQYAMRGMREKSIPLDNNNTQPIAIKPNNTLISFLTPKSLHGLNDKLKYVRASSFDLRKSGMVKEPLLGKVNPELINRAITRNRFQLQLCFELALRRNQALKGSMEWQWRLDTKGKISDIELVNSSISDRRMIRCVRKKISSWRLPKPRRGSVEVKYPFYFLPAKG